MLYFAYGSNMDPVQMARRCPGARFVGIARLADHRLGFTRRSKRRRCGVADIVPAPGGEVWGVVYRLLNPRDIAALDRAEGCRPDRRRRNAYCREQRVVHVPGRPRPLRVATYVANRQRHPPPPSAAYLDHLRRGAAHWGLPQSYRAFLANAIE